MDFPANYPYEKAYGSKTAYRYVGELGALLDEAVVFILTKLERKPKIIGGLTATGAMQEISHGLGAKPAAVDVIITTPPTLKNFDGKAGIDLAATWAVEEGAHDDKVIRIKVSSSVSGTTAAQFNVRIWP